MARMLQALKNLEARGQIAKPQAPAAPQEDAKSELSPAPREKPLAPPAERETPPGDGAPRPATQVVTTIDFAATQLASLNVSAEAGFLPQDSWSLEGTDGVTIQKAVAEALGSTMERALDVAVLPTALPLERDIEPSSDADLLPLTKTKVSVEERAEQSPQRVEQTPAVRPLTAIERSAARTLNHPPQARAVVDLADRLEFEAKQTGGESIVVVSLGSGRGTADALVLAGTLLAERRQRELLLVDADVARRGLTTALECLGKEGFADALVVNQTIEATIESLATRNLRLLPAGRGVDLDAKLAEPRLEALLKSLSQRYGLVLIDGGQAGSELSAALARQADATYLAVELGAVEASQAQAALRDLRAAGGRVLGCIAT